MRAGEGSTENEFAALEAAVLELAAVVTRRQRALDDEGEPTPRGVTFAQDEAALAELRRRFPLPAVYAEFLRRSSSHDFVDGGLHCGGRAAWITPVDQVAELVAVHADLRPGWLVCAIDYEGCYVLDLTRTAGGDCPVLFRGEGAEAREVAPSFVAFLRRVARESADPRAPRAASEAAVGSTATPQDRLLRLVWAAAVVLVVALVVGVLAR